MKLRFSLTQVRKTRTLLSQFMAQQVRVALLTLLTYEHSSQTSTWERENLTKRRKLLLPLLMRGQPTSLALSPFWLARGLVYTHTGLWLLKYLSKHGELFQKTLSELVPIGDLVSTSVLAQIVPEYSEFLELLTESKRYRRLSLSFDPTPALYRFPTMPKDWLGTPALYKHDRLEMRLLV